MMARCSVVIPYYQREAGVLSRALRSVFAQTFSDFDVILVDDASPLPVEGELAFLTDDERARVVVIHQENGGPGAARNTGLDNVPADTEFVALLDSDDEWTPDHLQCAVEALTRFDADCYWGTIGGGEAFHYHFGIERLPASVRVEALSTEPFFVEVPNLARAMLENWSFLHLSCMVLGRTLFGSMRFEAQFRLAAEDVLFFCDCILAARRVILCGSAGALRGEGVNIFHGIDNASPLFLRQQFNTWSALDKLEKRLRGDPAALDSIRSYKTTARQLALWSQVRRARLGKMPDFGLIAQWAWQDPRLVRSAAELAIRKISRRGAAGEAA
jgi:succinoglycan biosynthesis protein ExoW